MEKEEEKEMLVQIGCDFFKLELFKSVITTEELKEIINAYDVRLLKED